MYFAITIDECKKWPYQINILPMNQNISKHDDLKLLLFDTTHIQL